MKEAIQKLVAALGLLGFVAVAGYMINWSVEAREAQDRAHLGAYQSTASQKAGKWKVVAVRSADRVSTCSTVLQSERTGERWEIWHGGLPTTTHPPWRELVVGDRVLLSLVGFQKTDEAEFEWDSPQAGPLYFLKPERLNKP